MSAPAARVKICGITNRQDALDAIELGVSALGFNLFPGSKRFIEFDREAEWIASLPPFVTRVAVLVNSPLKDALQIASHRAIDMVQLHGDEDEAYCAQLARAGRSFIKALRLADGSAVDGANRFSTRHVLLDAHSAGSFGGTGTLLDLDLASECARRHPDLALLLAGGLTPVNVASAIRAVRPYAVDVATGVESSARSKSRELMQAFIEAVRRES
jgi:phosphoribosylanthranilate isomerase